MEVDLYFGTCDTRSQVNFLENNVGYGQQVKLQL